MKALFLLIFFTFASQSYSKTVEKPFHLLIDPKGTGGGPIYDEIVSRFIKVYKELGFKVKVEEVPSKRSALMVKKGQVDAELGRLEDTVKRDELIHPKTVIIETTLCLYSHPSKPQKPLKEALIGVPRGTRYIERLTGFKQKHFNNTEQTVNFYIERKKIDYVYGIKELLEQHPLIKLKGLECTKVLGKVKVYHILAEKNKYLVPLLDSILPQYFPIDSQKFLKQLENK